MTGNRSTTAIARIERPLPTTRDGAPLSRWDRLLLSIAPGWAMRRLRARAAAEMFARYYDAAASSRRTAGWHRRHSDANAALASSASTLRELSRDLRRNNGWARRGIQVIGNNVVGWGIEPKATGVSESLADRAMRVWRGWAESARCDYDGRMPFAGLQRLVIDTIVESGEVLVVRERASAADGLSVPIRVRILEPDYLDSTRDGMTRDGNPIIQGIELNNGRRVAYYMFKHHPGASAMGSTFESERIPAEDVLHIYRVERPGQMRGAPWLTAAIAKLQDFDDYDDAVLMQQKVAACFAAFVQDIEGTGTPLGQQDPDDEQVETLEPGHIEYLPPGKSVTFATPPRVGDHGTFTTTNLRRIAASLGVTYEDLTGDYSQVNFSSARMGRLSHWQNVYDWRWNMIIPQLCDRVWGWVMELARNIEDWNETPRAEWAPPPMPMLEPDKEGLAYSRLVRSGAMTLYQVIRERGEDPAAHLAEIAESNAKLDELGIVLDSDARRTSGAGLIQPEQPNSADS